MIEELVVYVRLCVWIIILGGVIWSSAAIQNDCDRGSTSTICAFY